MSDDEEDELPFTLEVAEFWGKRRITLARVEAEARALQEASDAARAAEAALRRGRGPKGIG